MMLTMQICYPGKAAFFIIQFRARAYFYVPTLSGLWPGLWIIINQFSFCFFFGGGGGMVEGGGSFICLLRKERKREGGREGGREREERKELREWHRQRDSVCVCVCVCVFVCLCVCKRERERERGIWSDLANRIIGLKDSPQLNKGCHLFCAVDLQK